MQTIYDDKKARAALEAVAGGGGPSARVCRAVLAHADEAWDGRVGAALDEIREEGCPSRVALAAGIDPRRVAAFVAALPATLGYRPMTAAEEISAREAEIRATRPVTLSREERETQYRAYWELYRRAVDLARRSPRRREWVSLCPTPGGDTDGPQWPVADSGMIWYLKLPGQTTREPAREALEAFIAQFPVRQPHIGATGNSGQYLPDREYCLANARIGMRAWLADTRRLHPEAVALWQRIDAARDRAAALRAARA